MTATTKNTNTENATAPAGTLYNWFGPFELQYVEAIAHGSPRPRNTFTELEPVTFPIAESAYSDCLAAVMDAKVSGSDVPRATIVIAVTDYSIPKTHPRTLAISPTTAVTRPIIPRDTMKAAFPFQMF